jgi:L-ribulose-5-phosphate 4-epimerase
MTVVLTELPEAVQEAVARTRERVAALHAELPRNGLVVWTAGNVSERVPRPSAGAPSAGPTRMPRSCSSSSPPASPTTTSPPTRWSCAPWTGRRSLDGTPASLSPSSDTAAHAYVYRHMGEVGGVVHTHSTYATAWAARGEEIPCVLTMMADEFGGPIPVGPFAVIGDDSIGQGIVETLRSSRSRPCSCRTTAPSPSAGTRARREGRGHVRGGRPHGARLAAARRPLPIAQEKVDSLFDRYQNVYGQQAPTTDPAQEA